MNTCTSTSTRSSSESESASAACCCCGPYPHIDVTDLFLRTTIGTGTGTGTGTATCRNTAKCSNSSTSTSESTADGACEGEDKNEEEHEHQHEHESTVLVSLREKVVEACERYGCFHISIDTDVFDNNNESDDDNHNHRGDEFGISILSDENLVKESIEHLFEPNFVKNDGERDGDRFDEDGIATFAGEAGCGYGYAKYRGRDAESGSIIRANATATATATATKNISPESKPEPKQSWEYFRCSNILHSQHHKHNTVNANDSDNDNTRLGILQDYTHIMHTIATTLFSPPVLNMPPNTFISTHDCTCRKKSPSSSTLSSTSSCSCCTMDLLRVFRYDAMTNARQQYAHLGSSPHTDWGSLTVVWQDSMGGLQIYCHDCDKWNDVDVGVDVDESAEEGMEANKSGEKKVHKPSTRTINFFIHVGDFTSLSMSGSGSGSGSGGEGGCSSIPKSSVDPSSNNQMETVVWPSPLHRVLCPLAKSENDNANDNDNDDNHHYGNYHHDVDDDDDGKECRASAITSRCSLVYFAYPPCGISIRDAQRSLIVQKQQQLQQQQKKQECNANECSSDLNIHTGTSTSTSTVTPPVNESEDKNEAKHSHEDEYQKPISSREFPFERFMVLKDQSLVRGDTNSNTKTNTNINRSDSASTDTSISISKSREEKESISISTSVEETVYKAVVEAPFDFVIQQKWAQVQR